MLSLSNTYIYTYSMKKAARMMITVMTTMHTGMTITSSEGEPPGEGELPGEGDTVVCTAQVFKHALQTTYTPHQYVCSTFFYIFYIYVAFTVVHITYFREE